LFYDIWLQHNDTFEGHIYDLNDFLKLDEVVCIYCTAEYDDIRKRHEEHNEEVPMCKYAGSYSGDELYYLLCGMVYEPKNVLYLNTSENDIDQCITKILGFLGNVERRFVNG